MKLTGKATIYVDGTVLRTENGAKLNPGGVSRKPERHGGQTYYIEEEVAPSLEATVQHTEDTKILDLGSITNATVMFECDTGQRYALRNAFTTDPVELDAGTGKAALKMSANSCDLV